MDAHSIELPRKILIGSGVLERVPAVTGNTGKPLVITGHRTRKVAGDRILGMYPNASLALVRVGKYREVRALKEDHTDIDCIICVGGGKVIDVGKLMAFDQKIPFVSVPTTLSHDGISSDRVSITHRETRHSMKTKPPLAIVADIEILKDSPYRLMASGCADVISNISAVYDWKLGQKRGEYYADYSAELALLSANHVIDSAKKIKERSPEGIRNLAEALISSGISMSLAGSSRPASGSEHMFSHALDALRKGRKGPLHGEQCGLGTIVTAYLQGQDWRKIKSVLRTIGAPTTAKQLGVPRGDLVKALLSAREVRERHTILDQKPLTEKSALKALKTTGVI